MIPGIFKDTFYYIDKLTPAGYYELFKLLDPSEFWRVKFKREGYSETWNFNVVMVKVKRKYTEWFIDKLDKLDNRLTLMYKKDYLDCLKQFSNIINKAITVTEK